MAHKKKVGAEAPTKLQGHLATTSWYRALQPRCTGFDNFEVIAFVVTLVVVTVPVPRVIGIEPVTGTAPQVATRNVKPCVFILQPSDNRI